LASINVVPPPFVLDLGDAPASYPVTLADQGARHIVGSLFLGATIDSETDGQPSGGADADGVDEDGVVAVADIVAVSGTDTTASFTVTASQSGSLDAWIDFSGDGDWNDTGEQIATSFAVNAGTNTLSFTTPGGAVPGDTAARFRLSSGGGLSPTGQADDGEVEDYIVTILDGSTSPDVTVDAVSGATTVVVAGDQIVVQTNPVLFSVPADSLGMLDVQGIADDETITLDFSGGSVIPPGGLRLDGAAGANTLSVIGADSELDFTLSTVSAQNFSTIDLGDDNVNVITIDAAVIRSLAPATNSVSVLGGEVAPGMRDVIVFADADDWRMGVTTIIGARFIRSVIRSPADGGAEMLETELPHAWQNVVKAGDVNNNGDVTAGDALVIINELARRAFSDPDTQFLDNPFGVAQWPGVYYDQNGDDKSTALDALRVINELARLSLGGGEQEAQAVDRAIDDWFKETSSGEETVTELNDAGSNAASKIASFGTTDSNAGSHRPRASVTEAHQPSTSQQQAVDELLSKMTHL
jgi:hypothetical protein